MRYRLKICASATALSIAVASSPPLQAQETNTSVTPEPEASAAPASESEIVVTGTRIQNSGFSSPTPVTSVGAAEIAARAPSNVADVLVTIPSFRPSNNPTSSGVNSRGGGLLTADLRGMGPDRTLVLVNGRRFVPSGTDGVVDLKLIPSLLVNSVETVTGGASAAYGSDAVTGVVNFILKDEIDGVLGSVQTGISEEGDNVEYRASLAAGTTLMDGRLRLMVGGDYMKSKGLGNQYTRSWGRKEVGLIANTNYATNGLPQYIITPGFHPSTMTPGGLITSGPLRGTAFNPDGSTYQFQFGDIFGASMIGGDNVGTNLSNATQLAIPYESKIVMGSVYFDATPNLTLFTEVTGAWSESKGHSQQPRDSGNITVHIDNAFLPESVRQALIDTGTDPVSGTFTMGRLYNDSGFTGINPSNKTFRIVGGAKGNIGANWNWDTYYQFGRNHYALTVGPNNRIPANFRLATDAVVDPLTGDIVCRSTLTDPTNGCKPQNIFGNGSVVVDDYSFGTAWFNVMTKQQVAAANLSGKLFENWAGDISLAFGGEYRKEEADGNSDALSQANAFQIGNQLPINGSYDVWEVYAETAVPLLRDSALGQALELNGAVRRADYSTSGAVVTWKLGGVYRPTDDIMIRATRSRDIRAPNLGELYQQGGSSYANVPDRALGGEQVQVREVSRGNLNLEPEKANTWTAGIVYQPHFVPGLSLSVDWYSIKLRGAIGTIASALAVERCDSGLTEYCSSVVRKADGTIDYVISQNLNLDARETSGIDFEARYDFDVGALPGRFTARVLGTYVDKFVTVDSTGSHDYVGKLSMFGKFTGVPHLTGNLDLTYRSDTFTANLLTRFVGKGRYDVGLVEGAGEINTINKNDVPAYAYVSLSLSKTIEMGSRNVEFFGLINNLFDTAPPLIPAGSIGSANETSTNPIFYDVIGRSYKFGIRFKI